MIEEIEKYFNDRKKPETTFQIVGKSTGVRYVSRFNIKNVRGIALKNIMVTDMVALRIATDLLIASEEGDTDLPMGVDQPDDNNLLGVQDGFIKLGIEKGLVLFYLESSKEEKRRDFTYIEISFWAKFKSAIDCTFIEYN